MQILNRPVNDIPQTHANDTKARSCLSIGEVLQAYKSKQSDIGKTLQACRERESSFGDIFQSINTHDNEKIAQLATKITHHTRSYTYHPDKTKATTKIETVGCKMEAYLDPSDPIKGSAPDNDQKEMMKALKTRHGKPIASSCFIRGHLLNDNLGGFGVKENLFPLTSSANGFHKNRVENRVKDCLYGPAHKPGLYYEVEVESQFDDTRAGDKFICKLQEWVPGTQTPIPGDLFNTNITSDLFAETGGSNSSVTYDFANDDVPDDWFPGARRTQHERKGLRNEFLDCKAVGKINVL